MDALGLQPIIDYLHQFNLPAYPTIIDKSSGKDVAVDDFDWIDCAAEIKRITSADSIIGFDIFPDPTDRMRNRIVLGVPETGSILPLYVLLIYPIHSTQQQNLSLTMLSNSFRLFRFSKSDYEKKLKILQNKRLQHVDSDSNDIELDDKDSETLNAYTSYMTEVISAFVFYSNPNANLELVLPVIKESANKIVQTTKFVLAVSGFLDYHRPMYGVNVIDVFLFHIPQAY